MRNLLNKILIVCYLTVITIGFTSSVFDPSFKENQLKFSRVRAAFQQKENGIKELLAKHKLNSSSLNIMLIAYKDESTLELWAADKKSTPYKLLKTYSVCSKSGVLGPKRQQGDNQVPEGLYYIDRFNPTSSYHLSLGLNYPNASDRILGSSKPGGDIFIHGKCVTIGCLPMTDDKINEIYALAVLAKTAGQDKIPVYIFPNRMDKSGMQQLSNIAAKNPSLSSFWNNLKVCHDRFKATRQPIPFSVNAAGRYELR